MTTVRLAVAVLLLGRMTAPALGQSSEVDDRPKYEIGAGASLAFRPYVDTPAIGLPSSVWLTASAGRFGLQVDWVRSVRTDPQHFTRYYLTADRQQYYDAASEAHHVEQVFGAAIKWPFPRHIRGFYWVLGAAWRYYTDRMCVAGSRNNPPEHGARLDHPPGFDCSREPVDYITSGLVPVYGLGLDIPVGARFFATVQYRVVLVPPIGDLRVGAGFRW